MFGRMDFSSFEKDHTQADARKNDQVSSPAHVTVWARQAVMQEGLHGEHEHRGLRMCIHKLATVAVATKILLSS